MNNTILDLIDRLEKNHSLSLVEYKTLIEQRDGEAQKLLAWRATEICKNVYGNVVYVRGLVEISNYCKNNCFYCGIRRDNRSLSRYRLTAEQILACCQRGYQMGFRTFGLQGGEDAYYTDDLLSMLIGRIKTACPGCAVTLSLGERGFESFKTLFTAGADRYLLRHETADSEHYKRLHPAEMSYEHRMRCLNDLRRIGYQTGCGFMVGSPWQTAAMLAQDLKFIEEFLPDMCGIGPFIPHHATPFAQMHAGSAELTCYLLSIVRLIHPAVLLPATTALGTISADGRELGILSGANVVMPNLTPTVCREKYALYDNKLCTGEEAGENIKKLAQRIRSIGYSLNMERGDVKRIG